MKISIAKYNYAHIAASLIAVALCVFAILRAIVIPITHDEALSLSIFASKPISEIFSYEGAGGMPNNHILNTLWMKFAGSLFGDSPLAIRFGSIIGLMLYCYSGFKLLTTLKSKLVIIGGMLLLCCNPFVFDFFSLARGYGIANGLMLIAVWQLYRWHNAPTVSKLVSLFGSGTLMTLANFSSIHIFLAFVFVVAILDLHRRGTVTIKNIVLSSIAPLVACIVTGCLLYMPFKEIMNGKGSFGGETGFWQDCVVWLISFSTYGARYSYVAVDIATWFVILTTLGIVITSAFFIIRKKREFLPTLAVLLLLPVLSTQVQHYALGTEFPVARTVQYMYPLFVLALLFWADWLNQKRAIGSAVIGIVGTLMLLHFLNVMQCIYVSQWKYDASNREVLHDIDQLRHENNSVLTLGITWVTEPGLNYEKMITSADWIAPLNRDGIAGEYDYYFVNSDDSLLLVSRGKRLVKHYPVSGNTFFK